MQCIGSLEAAEKHIYEKISKENLHISVKILQICMDLQDSVQRSLQKTAEEILQICTDWQRSKTWIYPRYYHAASTISIKTENISSSSPSRSLLFSYVNFTSTLVM